MIKDIQDFIVIVYPVAVVVSGIVIIPTILVIEILALLFDKIVERG